MLPEKKAVNLKTVAARVGLAPCSVSAVLNNTKAARAIPQKTKDRVYRAAAELNYRPNIVARSLRTKRTHMVAVIAPGLDGSGVARVVAAAQRRLHQSGYLLVLATSDGDGPNHLCAQLQQRGIEGVIAIDANLPANVNMPVTSVDLCYKRSATSVSYEMDLGNTVAETIIRQIENPDSQDSSRKMHIPAMPPAYVDLPSMDRGFSAAESA